MALDVKRNIVINITLIILSITFAFILAELSLRALKIGYGNAPLESHSVFHHVHPAEYRFVSHSPTGEYGGHEIYYDSERLVANPSAKYTEKQHAACRVAFLGDSFTEAGQVAFERSFVGMLQRKSDCNIKNYSTSSYSPIFYLLQWRNIVREFKPNLVVVQLYSNDISSDESYWEMARTDINGKVVAIPGPEGRWLTKQLRKSYLARLFRKVQLQLQWLYENKGKKNDIVSGMVEENPDISKLSQDIIIDLANEVRGTAAEFVLTVVPSKHRLVNNVADSQALQFSDKWKQWAQNNNIAFMDLTKAFEKQGEKGVKLFFDIDIHFNESGHIVVASELSKLYPHLFGTISNISLNHSIIP